MLCVADAGPAAGLGHISRSSAVAAALRARGIAVEGLALGASGDLERDGISWHAASPDTALSALARADTAVVDSYALDPDALAGEGVLVWFHDEGAVPGRAALVISPTSAEGPSGWATGLGHACLRPAFWGVPPREPAAAVGRVLVTTGAGDPGGGALRMVQAVREALPDARVRLVRGPSADGQAPAGVELVDAPEGLFRELWEADLAVCAAGQTALEAAAVGVPSVVIAAVANQAPTARALAALAIARVTQADVELGPAVGALAADAQARAAMSARAREAVDGFGALRVAGRIALLAARAAA